MSMRALIKKLKDRPKPDDPHLDERKNEWLTALDQLFTDIEGWLAPAVREGVLKTWRSETEIIEQDLGDYKAPMLEIHAGGLTVRLQPVGRLVAGVAFGGGRRLSGLRGRVDLICGPIKIPLVRTSSGGWKALPLRGDARDLTEKSLSEILEEVLLDE